MIIDISVFAAMIVVPIGYILFQICQRYNVFEGAEPVCDSSWGRYENAPITSAYCKPITLYRPSTQQSCNDSDTSSSVFPVSL